MIHGLPRVLRCICALACLSALQGCSYLFVSGPPDNYAQQPVIDCTTSKVAPVLDAVGAGFEAVRTGIALSADESDYYDYPFSRETDIVLGVGFFTLFTASAIYGFSETSACEEALATPRNIEWLAPAPAPAARPASSYGCYVDTQCKGTRVCERGQCVEPRVQPAVVPPAPPVLPPASDAPSTAPADPAAVPVPTPQPSAAAAPTPPTAAAPAAR